MKKNLIQHLTEELLKFKAEFASEEVEAENTNTEVEATEEETPQAEAEVEEVEAEETTEEIVAEESTEEVEAEAEAEPVAMSNDEIDALKAKITEMEAAMSKMTDLNIALSKQVEELGKAPAGEKIKTEEVETPIKARNTAVEKLLRKVNRTK